MRLREELVQFVEKSLLRGQQKIDPDDSLIDMGLIDSMGLLNVMTFLEERLGVRIPDEEVTAENFQSISAIERLIEKLAPKP